MLLHADSALGKSLLDGIEPEPAEHLDLLVRSPERLNIITSVTARSGEPIEGGQSPADDAIDRAQGEALTAARVEQLVAQTSDTAPEVIRAFTRTRPIQDLPINRFAINNAFYRGSLAGELEVAGVGASASAEAKTVTFVQDAYRAGTLNRSAVTQYWGAAVRISVTVDQWDTDAKLSLPLVAAKVEGEGLRAGFKFEFLGTEKFDEIAGKTPSVGTFDTTAYLRLTKMVNECTEIMLKLDKSELSPVLLFVESDDSSFAKIAYTWINALKTIRAGNDLGLIDQAGTGIDDAIIRALEAELKRAKPTNPRDWADQRLNWFREQLD